MSGFNKKSEQNYFEKTYDELQNLLTSERTAVVYRSLCALTTIPVDERIVPALKAIAESGTTFKNRKLAFGILTRNFSGWLNQIRLSERKTPGYVYFIQERLHGHVKIGRSRDLEKRFRLFITDLPFEVTLIQSIKTYNYERIELKFHELFASKRVKGEWFKLDDSEIALIKERKFPEEIEKLIGDDAAY